MDFQVRRLHSAARTMDFQVRRLHSTTRTMDFQVRRYPLRRTMRRTWKSIVRRVGLNFLAQAAGKSTLLGGDYITEK